MRFLWCLAFLEYKWTSFLVVASSSFEYEWPSLNMNDLLYYRAIEGRLSDHSADNCRPILINSDHSRRPMVINKFFAFSLGSPTVFEGKSKR